MRKTACFLIICLLLAVFAMAAEPMAAVAPAVLTAPDAAPAPVTQQELTALTAESDGGMGLQAVLPTSGKCGDNLTWYYGANTLTIVGTGAMYDYENVADKAPEYLRYYCNDIKSVYISNNVTELGDYTFWGCQNLTTITIQSTVLTRIGAGAFYSAGNLRNITIPACVTTIGDSAFGNCPYLTNIQVAAANTAFTTKDGVLFDKAGTRLICCPRGISGSYTVPETVTSIESWAFHACGNLTDVVLPAGLLSIGDYAFRQTGVRNVTLPDSLTHLGEGAYYSCGNLQSVTVPAGVTVAAPHLFRLCASLTTVTLPNTMTTIDQCAFIDCKALTNLTLPADLTTIGQFAFQDCTALTNLVLPDGIKTIENSAFLRCTALQYAVYGNGNYLGTAANDYYCLVLPVDAAAATVAIHPNAVMVADYAFRGSGLTALTVPENMVNLGEGAFCSSKALASVTLPDTLTEISPWCFYGDSALTALAIPAAVTSIGNYAFRETGLTSVSTAADLGEGAFYNCQSLLTATLNEGTETLGRFAFQNCTALTEVYLPFSLQTVSNQAFYKCNALADVYYASSYAADWEAISIGSFNEPLTAAALHLQNFTYDASAAGTLYAALFGADGRMTQIRIIPVTAAGTVEFSFAKPVTRGEILHCFLLDASLAPV